MISRRARNKKKTPEHTGRSGELNPKYARVPKESAELFRDAFNHSAIGTALVSLEGRWLSVNPALTSMLGYSEEELLATNFQAVSHAEDLPRNLFFRRRALNGGIGQYELEKRYIHKDGHTLTALLTAKLVRDSSRRPLYFVSHIQNLTERAREQPELNELRLTVARLDRLALMGKLTASLAHELLQPITAIMANAETCQRLIESDCVERQELLACLDDIQQSSDHAGKLIQRVRTLSQQQPQTRGRVDLNRIVREIVDVARAHLQLRGVRLITRFATSALTVHGDPAGLQQMVLNLLMNAADAMSRDTPDGGELLVTTRSSERQVELTLAGCGCGGKRAHIGRWVEPVSPTRCNGTTLNICAGIARSHGGHVWVRSTPVGGMIFHLCLPAGDRRGRKRERIRPAAA
jgi:PAS domain S-box-containing protein